MIGSPTTPPGCVAPESAATMRMFLTAAFERILVWITVGRTRRMLATLDDRTLQDLGLDRATAAEEYGKPFWRSR